MTDDTTESSGDALLYLEFLRLVSGMNDETACSLEGMPLTYMKKLYPAPVGDAFTEFMNARFATALSAMAESPGLHRKTETLFQQTAEANEAFPVAERRAELDFFYRKFEFADHAYFDGRSEAYKRSVFVLLAFPMIACSWFGYQYPLEQFRYEIVHGINMAKDLISALEEDGLSVRYH